MPTHDDETELDVLPFVSLVSNGGPHDDDSFTAGFEMGQLDVILGFQWMQLHSTVIQTANVKQADLIAMHYDFKMEIEGEEDNVTSVTFVRVCTCDDAMPDETTE